MQKTIHLIDFNALAKRASGVQSDIESSLTSCSINQFIFAAGWYNIVFEIALEDGIYWIAHIPREPETGEDLGPGFQRVKEMESEVYTILYVKANSTISVP